MFDNYKLVDINHNVLSDSDRKIFDRFVDLIKESSSTFVYRGERRVDEIYCSYSIDELLHKIFLIGCKGEHFRKQKSKYITKTICKKTFEQLFNNYSYILNRNDIKSVRTKEHIIHFWENNKVFCLYFSKSANRVTIQRMP